MAVDADGLGAGVFDRLVELGHSVTEFRGGQPAVEPEDFVNRRSEWYWNLRLRFENGEIDIDPNDDVLAKRLVAIKWKMTSKGQIAVETRRRCESATCRHRIGPTRLSTASSTWTTNLWTSRITPVRASLGI